MSKRFNKQLNNANVPPEDNRKRGGHKLLLNFQNYPQWKKITSSELIITYGSMADFTSQEGKNIVLYKPQRPVRDWTVIGQSNGIDDAHSSSASASRNNLSADQVPLPPSETGDEVSNISNSSLSQVTAQEALDREYEFKKLYDLYTKEKWEMMKAIPKLYQEIISRCSDQSLAKMRELEGFLDEIKKSKDVVKLWKRIAYVHQNYVSGVKEEDALEGIKKLVNIQQGKGEDLTVYKNRFDATATMCETVCASIGMAPLPEKIHVAAFTTGLNSNFNDYKKHVSNNTVSKLSEYPPSVGRVYEEAGNWRVTVNRNQQESSSSSQSSGSNAQIFLTESKSGGGKQSDSKKGNKDSNKKKSEAKSSSSEENKKSNKKSENEELKRDKNGNVIKCRNSGCGGNHYDYKCPITIEALAALRSGEKSIFVCFDHLFAMSSSLSENVFLVDNQCTQSVFCKIRLWCLVLDPCTLMKKLIPSDLAKLRSLTKFLAISSVIMLLPRCIKFLGYRISRILLFIWNLVLIWFSMQQKNCVYMPIILRIMLVMTKENIINLKLL